MDLFDLKPCPVCGGTAKLQTIPKGAIVQCENCELYILVCKTEKEAIEAWNESELTDELREAINTPAGRAWVENERYLANRRKAVYWAESIAEDSEHYGRAISEALQQLAKSGVLSYQHEDSQFIIANGYKYKTGQELTDALYRRSLARANKVQLSEQEFAAEGGTPPARGLYNRLCDLRSKEIIQPIDFYNFAHHKWCWHDPAAVVYAVDRNANECLTERYKVNTCDRVISHLAARRLIGHHYCFDERMIVILGRAFYDTEEWNFIKFATAKHVFLMYDGELYFSE